MNQQPPYFTSPETYHPEMPYRDPRPINTDPREQRGVLPPVLNTDPREQPQWQGMPPAYMARPPQPQPNPWRWLGLSVIILVVVFGGIFSASALLTHQISDTTAFPVGSAPKLVVTSDSGDVHIFSGPSNQITVVAHESVFVGDNDQIPAKYSLSSDHETLTVSASAQPTVALFGFNENGVDFDITVPSQTALNIHADSGDVTSNGVVGTLTLTSGSGDVTTDGGSGQITLTSNSGDIHASNVSGQMTLSSDSGDVTALNASASGNSTFQTDSGDITFSGSLDPTGQYTFHDDSGDVDLTLPANASFQVQASTDSGDIHSDFPGVIVQSGDSGAQASGGAGGTPQAKISIQTDSGDIHLRQA